MQYPLEGIKVVDLSQVLMGPLCTQVLADNGATVYKVERLGGDSTRWIGPSRTSGMGPLFLHLNRGKKGLAMDLKDARCREAVYRMVAESDVVVHNLRPKVVERLGFGFRKLSEINPSIVYCSLYGYGQEGPYADRPAYDDLIQGAVALPHLQQRAGSSYPQYVTMTIADRLVGLSAAYAISMGLFARQRTGKAQEIDIPMFETVSSQVLSDHLYGRSFVPELGSSGYPRLLTAERRPYQTADGYLCAAIYTDQHWDRFLRKMGRTDVLENPIFQTLNARIQHIDAVSAFLADIMLTETNEYWTALFDELDIPVAPLNTVDSLIDDAQLGASDLVFSHEHPTEGEIRTVGNPILWNREHAKIGFAPQLGEHTGESLREFGFSGEDIEAMAREGVIFDRELSNRLGLKARVSRPAADAAAIQG